MVILGVNFALTFIYRPSRCVQFHRVSFLKGVDIFDVRHEEARQLTSIFHSTPH